MLHRAPYRSIRHCLLQPALLLMLSACASAPNTPPPPPPELQGSPPPVAGRIPTDYRKIDGASAQRPDWTLNEPDDKDGLHYMVALSEHHASEQAAREEAMTNARKAYAQYTGVEVAEVDEVIRAMYGQSSDVLDPTIAGRSKSSQTTDAQVSRIKAKQWYWERYAASKSGINQGQTYKYWVLVTVPTDEYDRVQKWKADKVSQQLQREQMLEQQAERELQELLKGHAAAYSKLQEELQEGEPVEALTVIMPEWSRLGEAIKRFKEKSDPYRRRVAPLESAQRETIDWISKTRGSLVFDNGHAASYCALSAPHDFTLPIWVLSKTPQRTPVIHLPLTLSDPSGSIIARTSTDLYGRAEFQVTRLNPGRYRVGIDPQGGILATLDANLVNTFTKVEGFITVTTAPGDFEGTIHNALQQLFAGPSHQPLLVNRLTLGPVTYGSSRQGSELSLAVQRQLRQELTRISGLTVIEPRQRDVQVVAQAITRGIALADTGSTNADPPPDLGSAAMQAVIDGAQAALETSFTISGSSVILDMTLREAATDKLLAAASATLPRRSIAADIDIIPQLQPESPPPPTQPAGETIKLQLSSQLGDGQTYQEGESIAWFVSADRDAYLLLLYEDVAHNLIQILPNRYSGSNLFKAGNFVQIPGKKDRFEFTITSPFGLERVHAFAASQPFPPLPAAELENGLSLLQIGRDQAFAILRRHSQSTGVAYGEAETVITTVAKP